MLRRAPPHHMQQMYARLERTHHAGRGLVEHPARNVIKQMTFELKVDDKIDLCGIAYRNERPPVCQMLQRSIDGRGEHLSPLIE